MEFKMKVATVTVSFVVGAGVVASVIFTGGAIGVAIASGVLAGMATGGTIKGISDVVSYIKKLEDENKELRKDNAIKDKELASIVTIMAAQKQEADAAKLMNEEAARAIASNNDVKNAAKESQRQSEDTRMSEAAKHNQTAFANRKARMVVNSMIDDINSGNMNVSDIGRVLEAVSASLEDVPDRATTSTSAGVVRHRRV